MTNTTTFQTVLKELADAFTADTRNDGTTYTRLKDVRPAWLEGSDVMLAIHGAVDDRMPDDWIYEATAGLASTMTGYDASDADEMRDNVHEIADGQVDVYNADRLRWLASHLGNAALVDEACSELGCDPDADTFTRIGLGQYLALTRIAEAIIAACDAEADARDEGAADSEEES